MDSFFAIAGVAKAFIELKAPPSPDRGDSHLGRGNAYDELGQYAKADANKAKVCSLDSQHCD